MAQIYELTDDNFQETIQGETPILIDFWADWCAPCKMLSPIVAELATDLEGRLRIGKLDVDENPMTAQNFGIMSIPTLLVFKDGEVVKSLIGYMSKKDLLSRLSDVI